MLTIVLLLSLASCLGLAPRDLRLNEMVFLCHTVLLSKFRRKWSFCSHYGGSQSVAPSAQIFSSNRRCVGQICPLMTGGDGRLCGLGEGMPNKTKPSPFLFEVCLRDCGLGKVFNQFFICKMGKNCRGFYPPGCKSTKNWASDQKAKVLLMLRVQNTRVSKHR